MERSALKIHRRVFVSCSRAKGCNFCGLLTFCSETFLGKLWRNCGDRWGKLSCVRKHKSHPAASLRWLARKNFFWPIRSRQFKRFWNWFGKSKCPGARLDLTENFHHEHFIDPTNCPWVSEDGDQYHVVIRHLLFLPSSVMILLSFLSCFLVPCVYFIAWLRLSLNYNQFRVLQAVDSFNVKHELWSKRVMQLISCSVSRRHSKRYFLVCHLKIVFYFLHELKQRSSDVTGRH